MNMQPRFYSIFIEISIVLTLFMLIPATAFSMACSYDKNGNMISDGKQCYEYNDANRLSRVSNCYSDQLIAEYFYDHAGQRLKKKEYESNVLKHTTYYIGKHYETKVYPDGRSEKTSYYFAGSERIARKDPDGKKYFYHSDHLGSNSVITDENGQLVEKTKYTPFGSVTAGGAKSKYLYTGQEKDVETGLYYYGARYYNPELRRFVQADSILPDVYDPQQLNRYSYVKNNPLKYIDPDGRESKDFDFDSADKINTAFWSNARKGKPAAMVITDPITNKTSFYYSRTTSSGLPEVARLTIDTLVKVDWQGSKPGAEDAYISDNVRYLPGNDKPEFGKNAYIDTDDDRGRDLHGGGSNLENPFLPRQGWLATMGCTRGQNEDVQLLGMVIDNFRSNIPDYSIPIPYIRSHGGYRGGINPSGTGSLHTSTKFNFFETYIQEPKAVRQQSWPLDNSAGR